MDGQATCTSGRFAPAAPTVSAPRQSVPGGGPSFPSRLSSRTAVTSPRGSSAETYQRHDFDAQRQCHETLTRQIGVLTKQVEQYQVPSDWDRERVELVALVNGLVDTTDVMLQRAKSAYNIVLRDEDASTNGHKSTHVLMDSNSPGDAIERLERQLEEMSFEVSKALAVASAAQSEKHLLLEENARLRSELAKAASATPTASDCSGCMLKKVMTTQGSASSQLRSAINAVGALVDEARRELTTQEHRERRAAFEELHRALDEADEARLEAALEDARSTGVEMEDIGKAEAKLLELKSLTPEQRKEIERKVREKERKEEAYLCVKKDDADKLKALLDELDAEGVQWKSWRDYAGRSLAQFAKVVSATDVIHIFDLLEPKAEPAKRRPSKFADAEMVAAVESARRRAVDADLSAADIFSEHPSSLSRQLSEGRGSEDSIGVSGSPEGNLGRKVTVVNLDDLPENASSTLTTPQKRPTPDPGVDHDILASPRIESSPGIFRSMMTMNLSLDAKEEDVIKTQALRAVAQDKPDDLILIFQSVPLERWSRWQNRAGKTLEMLAEERGATNAYTAICKALGKWKEAKRHKYAERETVWVFIPGEVQPRRATVMEDTPEEADEILVQYWDGNEDALLVDRGMVRKSDHY